MASRAFIQQVLRVNSTKKFYIEYSGFLSNHMAHGIIALGDLGATEERINSFVNELGEGLEPAAPHFPKPTEEVFNAEGKPRGERENFYGFVQYYKDQVESMGIDQAVKKYFPSLSSGLSGAAFHGMIHLGYGYHAGSPEVVSEGLAYLHFAGTDLVPREDASPNPERSNATLPEFRESLVVVISSIKRDNPIHAAMKRSFGTKLRKNEAILGSFQKRLLALERVESDLVNDKLEEIGDVSRVDPLWLVDCMLALLDFSATKDHVDFFVLHLVTSAWSLTQIKHLLSDSHRELAVKQFLLAAIGSYVARDCPPFSPDNTLKDVSESWESIAERCIGQSRDEHVYKLVQVAKDMATLAEKDGYQPDIYKSAAIKTVDRELLIMLPSELNKNNL